MAPATEHENTENNKVILGATGVTDLQIVKQVLERDYQITALLRNTKKLGYIETKRLESTICKIIQCNVMNLTDLSKNIRELTAVLSALGYALVCQYSS
ncbi:unnamed protein product [Rotaria magnacalcarata]|uniref:NAD(P)-binding domain-containing protein n=1 Tax=Rotaria magnacalcarata TaxID=392030 RepID=A0A8S2RAB6_9BILA|nr:unnamed protein product [Rotaria magnacalcarata]CAF5169798.1 unnamed protein product [Rotaria magnacalcarata]CAF5224100.1 unnamed protein product [Rotaria magnacalcarata]